MLNHIDDPNYLDFLAQTTCKDKGTFQLKTHVEGDIIKDKTFVSKDLKVLFKIYKLTYKIKF